MSLGWLLLAAVVQLVGLFFWDTFSLWWLYSQPSPQLSFLTVLRARADVSAWTAVNLEIGQAVFGGRLAQITGLSVRAALSLSVVVGFFDFATIVTLALIGTLLRPDPSLFFLRWVSLGVLGGMTLFVLALCFLPDRWRQWSIDAKVGEWLQWWSWRHTGWLALQRLILILLILLYAGISLALCGLPSSVGLVCAVIPCVLLAEALPSAGGLGTRETTLLTLLPVSTGQSAVVLSFSLIWSTVLIVGRVAISLVSWFLPGRTRK